MGIQDAAGAAISGVWDKFEAARGVGRWIEKLMAEDRAENGSPLVEYHPGDGLYAAPHLHDPDEELHKMLAEAKKHIDDAELLYQQVLAAI